MRWRWDQGRLGYFQYANLVLTAKVLSGLVGTVINPRDGTDPLRQPLERYTGLPFSPAHYKVWRNYARVFQCAMLATSINGRLFVTDICKLLLLPPSEFSSDQYFNLLFSRFSYPFAPFEDYNVTHAQVFPFLAIMKLAMSRGNKGFRWKMFLHMWSATTAQAWRMSAIMAVYRGVGECQSAMKEDK